MREGENARLRGMLARLHGPEATCWNAPQHLPQERKKKKEEGEKNIDIFGQQHVAYEGGKGTAKKENEDVESV